MMDFSGKTILITGGSRGIGKAAAIAFAQANGRVAINFKQNSEAALEVIHGLPGEGHIAIKADITNPNAVRKLTDKVLEVFGKIDVLVNNAGIFTEHKIDEVDYETWQSTWTETLNLNLIAASNLCYCVAQHMIARKTGRIINVSSRGAFRGEPEFPAYGASKAALNALSQSLAKRLGPYQIGVTAIAPGFVETDMAAPALNGPNGDAIKNQSPMGRVATPEEIAHGILFYASEKALFATGGILDINGASYLRT